MIKKFKTKRLVVPDEGGTFTVPAGIQHIQVTNVGTKDFTFQGVDDGASDYKTIKVDGETPVMNVDEGQQFIGDGIGGATTVEILMWG